MRAILTSTPPIMGRRVDSKVRFIARPARWATVATPMPAQKDAVARVS